MADIYGEFDDSDDLEVRGGEMPFLLYPQPQGARREQQ
jgi:hypothetical protein